MPEKMAEFFEARLEDYGEHMLTEIESAGEFDHYDTPLTVDNETEVLLAAGFDTVEVLGQWGCTSTLRAVK